MRNIKISFGILLLSLGIIIGFLTALETLNLIDLGIIDRSKLGNTNRRGTNRPLIPVANNHLIFLGLCTIAGSILLAYEKSEKIKEWSGGDYIGKSASQKFDKKTKNKIQVHLKQGNIKFYQNDLDGALIHFNEVISLSPNHSPKSHFNLACIYSLKHSKEKAFYHLEKSVQQGFKEMNKIKESGNLNWLRRQEEFATFINNGYRIPTQKESNDKITQLERLGVLKEKGLLTEEEFNQQKSKLLSK